MEFIFFNNQKVLKQLTTKPKYIISSKQTSLMSESWLEFSFVKFSEVFAFGSLRKRLSLLILLMFAELPMPVDCKFALFILLLFSSSSSFDDDDSFVLNFDIWLNKIHSAHYKFLFSNFFFFFNSYELINGY